MIWLQAFLAAALLAALPPKPMKLRLALGFGGASFVLLIRGIADIILSRPMAIVEVSVGILAGLCAVGTYLLSRQKT